MINSHDLFRFFHLEKILAKRYIGFTVKETHPLFFPKIRQLILPKLEEQINQLTTF